MRRCVECDELIEQHHQTHFAHEPGCDADPASADWMCRCDDAWAHAHCCRACKPLVPVPVRGEQPEPASTRGLPKRANA